MSSTAELQSRTLKRGQAVRLVEDIPGHPAGSSAKVALANGVTWLRYWLRFSDGSSVGHIDHSVLVRAKDYDKFLRSRELEATAAQHEAEAASQESADADSPGEGGNTGGATEVNGVVIPQLLLDRSAAARVRLGA